MGIFELYPTARWTVRGTDVYFAVSQIDEIARNRIAQHERIYRDGARLDDTFRKATVWKLTILAINSENAPDDVNNSDFYPTELNKLCDSLEVHETGTLTVPTRGDKRCRFEGYDRSEKAGERDAAAVVLTFIEDNEDDAEAAAFQAPTAASVAKQTAEDCIRELEDIGISGDLASGINQLASDIEGLASAPGEFAGDLEDKAALLSRKTEQMQDTFEQLSTELESEVRNLMTDPAASRAGRLLNQLNDIAGRAVRNAVENTVDIVEFITVDFTTMFAIAASNNVAADLLIRLNPAINAFSVPPNTSVKLPKPQSAGERSQAT